MKQVRRPGMGIYFALIVLLLAAYYFLYGSTGASTVSFAQVETLFEKGKVTSFSIRDGNDLYLNLQDGTTVHNELGRSLGLRYNGTAAAYRRIIIKLRKKLGGD